MPNWSAEHIRLTLFPARDFRAPDPNWWRMLVGRDPQAKTVQQGIGIQETGPINEHCTLTLDLGANRIDLLMSPVVQPTENPTAFPTFDSCPQAFDAFRDLGARLLPHLTDIRRMAIGGVMIAPVADKVAGYRELVPLLPSVRLDPATSSDFSYSINRHATSPQACPDLHVNRLSIWGVASLAGIRIQIDGSNVGVTMNQSGSGVSALRLQFDVNTDAERRDNLPNDRLEPLFGELLGFARNIVERGDVP